MALIPGICAAAWGYRRQLKHSQQWLKWLLPPSLIGGLIGALLVVGFPDEFSALVPWLILTAAVLFVLQPQIARWTGVGLPHDQPSTSTVIGIVVFQFFVAVYGGYFGAGIGILMLSSLGLMGLADIHVMNGLKNCLAFAMNLMAVIVFLTRGQIDWSLALPMIGCSIVGGFVGPSSHKKSIAAPSAGSSSSSASHWPPITSGVNWRDEPKGRKSQKVKEFKKWTVCTFDFCTF